MPTWLLTSTTYGTWLPGDQRGCVTSVREQRPGEALSSTRREHDQVGQPYETHLPGLQQSSQQRLKSPPVLLSIPQAKALLAQFRQTAEHRGHRLLAAAIMANHFHIVVTPPGDPAPGKLLGEFKAYGSRRLSQLFARPASGTWWTARGSKRKLPDDRAVAAAINYVLYTQPNPLVTWSPESTA